MHDKVDRRPFAHRYDSELSESESHALMSSDASHASHSSFGATFMFHDSETSDVDNPAPPRRQTQLPPQPAAPRPQHLSSSRRPFVVSSNSSKIDDDSLIAMTANRYQYYNKLKSYAPDDPALLIPDHVIPTCLLNKEGKGKQSSIVTIFTVWNTILGSSLLAMPWGIEQSGLFTGLLIMLLMGGLCLYTTYRILQVHKLHSTGDPDGEVAELSRYLLGRPAEMVAKSFSVVVLLGAIIAYWILMSNFLYNLVNYIYDRFIVGEPIESVLPNSTAFAVTCPRYNYDNVTEEGTGPEIGSSKFHKVWDLHTVPIFLAPLIGCLVNFKSVTFFTKFNSLGTLSVMYVIVFVIIKSISWGINIEFKDTASPSYSPQFLPGFPALSGMLAMSFFIHNIIISIMRNNRHQDKNGRDLTIAYILVTLTYTLIGTAFYVCFPLAKSCIEDNLLNNFYSWDIMTVLARAFLFFQLVTVYPLLIFMLRSQLFTAILHNPYPGRLHVIGLNSILITVCVLFAIFLPRIGTIIRFTGAISGLVYVFTLPSLLHLASEKKHGNATCLSTVVHLAIPVIGALNLFAQFFVSDN